MGNVPKIYWEKTLAISQNTEKNVNIAHDVSKPNDTKIPFPLNVV